MITETRRGEEGVTHSLYVRHEKTKGECLVLHVGGVGLRQLGLVDKGGTAGNMEFVIKRNFKGGPPLGN